MKKRTYSSLVFCCLISLASVSRAEQRPFVTPPVEIPSVPLEPLSESGNPQWLRDELARREQISKNRERLKPANTVQPVPEPAKDLGGYGQLGQPLDSRRTEQRLLPHVPEVQKEYRAVVPLKGARIPKPNLYSDDIGQDKAEDNAEVVPLPITRDTRVAPPERNDLSEAVDLNALPTQGSRAAVRNSALEPSMTRDQLADPVDLSAIPQSQPREVLNDRALNRVLNSARERSELNSARERNELNATQIPRETLPAIARGELAETVDVIRILSRIERLYNFTDGLSRRRNLEQFGYKSFAGGLRSDALAGIDPDFILGAGDEVRVRSVEGFVFDKTLTIDRDGTIFIDPVGAINVAGLKARDLASTIEAALTQRGLKNFRLDVTLGKLHSIRVMVAGIVKFPGLQNIPANSTLMDALMLVGGPTKDGTLRNVIVQRPGKEDLRVDLYNILASADKVEDVVLLSGDRIYVGPIGPTAAIIGPSGSGIYELLGKTVLEGLMRYAGNINGFTQLNNVQVERTYDNARRNVRLLDYKAEAANFELQDGDVIAFTQISGQLNDTVAINGAVVRPNTYPIRAGMKVSDLIKASGGFLIDANLDRALLLRPLGNQALFDNMLGDKAGRTREEAIWIDLAAIIADNKEADVPLRRLDSLKIFTQNEVQDVPTVKIIGGIRKPGTYRLTAGMNLGDLIRVAGGPTPDAFAGESTIVRRKRAAGDMHMDVEIIPFRLDNVQRRISDYDEPLNNQDQVVIKRVQSMQVNVRIGGRVQFPGTHVLPDGAKISDLLAAAGGLLPDADLRAAVFTRKRIQLLQQARLDDLFTRMEQTFNDKRNSVIKNGRNNEGISAHLAYLGLGNLTTNIERFQARGRLVINMTCHDFFGSHHNVTLEEGDELYIPRRENIVMVLGETNYPNAFVWENFMTVGDYLNKAGGLLKEADKDQIYVVMANGEVYSDNNKSLWGGNVRGFRPGPGDSILVPKKAPSRSKFATASDVALLMRQFAETGLVAASIPQALQPNNPANVGIQLNGSNQSPPDIINSQSSDSFYNDTRNSEFKGR